MRLNVVTSLLCAVILGLCAQEAQSQFYGSYWGNSEPVLPVNNAENLSGNEIRRYRIPETSSTPANKTENQKELYERARKSKLDLQLWELLAVAHAVTRPPPKVSTPHVLRHSPSSEFPLFSQKVNVRAGVRETASTSEPSSPGTDQTATATETSGMALLESANTDASISAITAAPGTQSSTVVADTLTETETASTEGAISTSDTGTETEMAVIPELGTEINFDAEIYLPTSTADDVTTSQSLSSESEIQNQSVDNPSTTQRVDVTNSPSGSNTGNEQSAMSAISDHDNPTTIPSENNLPSTTSTVDVTTDSQPSTGISNEPAEILNSSEPVPDSHSSELTTSLVETTSNTPSTEIETNYLTTTPPSFVNNPAETSTDAPSNVVDETDSPLSASTTLNNNLQELETTTMNSQLDASTPASSVTNVPNTSSTEIAPTTPSNNVNQEFTESQPQSTLSEGNQPSVSTVSGFPTELEQTSGNPSGSGIEDGVTQIGETTWPTTTVTDSEPFFANTENSPLEDSNLQTGTGSSSIVPGTDSTSMINLNGGIEVQETTTVMTSNPAASTSGDFGENSQNSNDFNENSSEASTTIAIESENDVTVASTSTPSEESGESVLVTTTDSTGSVVESTESELEEQPVPQVTTVDTTQSTSSTIPATGQEESGTQVPGELSTDSGVGSLEVTTGNSVQVSTDEPVSGTTELAGTSITVFSTENSAATTLAEEMTTIPSITSPGSVYPSESSESEVLVASTTPAGTFSSSEPSLVSTSVPESEAGTNPPVTSPESISSSDSGDSDTPASTFTSSESSFVSTLTPESEFSTSVSVASPESISSNDSGEPEILPVSTTSASTENEEITPLAGDTDSATTTNDLISSPIPATSQTDDGMPPSTSTVSSPVSSTSTELTTVESSTQELEQITSEPNGLGNQGTGTEYSLSATSTTLTQDSSPVTPPLYDSTTIFSEVNEAMTPVSLISTVSSSPASITAINLEVSSPDSITSTENPTSDITEGDMASAVQSTTLGGVYLPETQTVYTTAEFGQSTTSSVNLVEITTESQTYEPEIASSQSSMVTETSLPTTTEISLQPTEFVTFITPSSETDENADQATTTPKETLTTLAEFELSSTPGSQITAEITVSTTSSTSDSSDLSTSTTTESGIPSTESQTSPSSEVSSDISITTDDLDTEVTSASLPSTTTNPDGQYLTATSEYVPDDTSQTVTSTSPISAMASTESGTTLLIPVSSESITTPTAEDVQVSSTNQPTVITDNSQYTTAENFAENSSPTVSLPSTDTFPNTTPAYLILSTESETPTTTKPFSATEEFLPTNPPTEDTQHISSTEYVEPFTESQTIFPSASSSEIPSITTITAMNPVTTEDSQYSTTGYVPGSSATQGSTDSVENIITSENPTESGTSTGITGSEISVVTEEDDLVVGSTNSPVAPDGMYNQYSTTDYFPENSAVTTNLPSNEIFPQSTTSTAEFETTQSSVSSSENPTVTEDLASTDPSLVSQNPEVTTTEEIITQYSSTEFVTPLIPESETTPSSFNNLETISTVPAANDSSTLSQNPEVTIIAEIQTQYSSTEFVTQVIAEVSTTPSSVSSSDSLITVPGATDSSPVSPNPEVTTMAEILTQYSTTEFENTIIPESETPSSVSNTEIPPSSTVPGITDPSELSQTTPSNPSEEIQTQYTTAEFDNSVMTETATPSSTSSSENPPSSTTLAVTDPSLVPETTPISTYEEIQTQYSTTEFENFMIPEAETPSSVSSFEIPPSSTVPGITDPSELSQTTPVNPSAGIQTQYTTTEFDNSVMTETTTPSSTSSSEIPPSSTTPAVTDPSLVPETTPISTSEEIQTQYTTTEFENSMIPEDEYSSSVSSFEINSSSSPPVDTDSSLVPEAQPVTPSEEIQGQYSTTEYFPEDSETSTSDPTNLENISSLLISSVPDIDDLVPDPTVSYEEVPAEEITEQASTEAPDTTTPFDVDSLLTNPPEWGNEGPIAEPDGVPVLGIAPGIVGSFNPLLPVLGGAAIPALLGINPSVPEPVPPPVASNVFQPEIVPVPAPEAPLLPQVGFLGQLQASLRQLFVQYGIFGFLFLWPLVFLSQIISSATGGRSFSYKRDYLADLVLDLSDGYLDEPLNLVKTLAQIFPEQFEPPTSPDTAYLNDFLFTIFPEQLEPVLFARGYKLPVLLSLAFPAKIGSLSDEDWQKINDLQTVPDNPPMNTAEILADIANNVITFAVKRERQVRGLIAMIEETIFDRD